jgi:cellulose synthase/poly-beta-1,6-N-acetylglucosamine synthase-like glycosyltransferase
MFSRDLADGIDLLSNLEASGLIAMLWYLIVFEIPRYGLSFLSLVFLPFYSPSFADPRGQARASALREDLSSRPTVSVVVVGHSEERALETCIESLRAQSLKDFEIVVVSDGSRDDMIGEAERLRRLGKIDRVLATDLRCGKSAGMNLAVRAASGDIIINVDCDCSYDRFALERILRPFDDQIVGAVCGDIVPRNSKVSLIAAMQTIEYLISISLAKRVADMLGQVVCISGAFGAFRREALESVGGMDPGGGEDLDVTIRLRAKGWRMRFEPDAVCYTDVPAVSWSLVRQRLRWERDCIRVRFRKHKRLLSPWSLRFHPSETIHQIDFAIFHVVFAFLFPVYISFLWLSLSFSFVFVLIAVQVVAMLMDTLAFIIAIAITGRWSSIGYAAYLPVYGLYTGLFMRLIRLWAYIDEWAFDSSRWDSYVPGRVTESRQW